MPGSDIPEYIALFDCMNDPQSRRYLSEDYAFCRRHQIRGGDVWADTESPLAHVGSYIYGRAESAQGFLGASSSESAASQPMASA